MRIVGALAIVLSCVACSSAELVSPAASDGGGIDGSPDGSAVADAGDGEAQAPDAGPVAPSFCTAEVPVVVTTGAGVTATTTHYELYAEATVGEATELARLLEASAAALASWFERAVPQPRMKVKLYADVTSWTAGLAADGISTPTDAAGYFDPGTKTAYLYRQGNPYYTHVLLVHEATHQFHHLARLQGQALPFWYMEGHAEYLSRHDWDGECVRLGVTSMLSWEDLPAKAAAGSIDVAGIVDGSVTATRASAWAMFRYLDTGPLRAGFKAYRDGMDGNTSPSFTTTVADPASLAAPMAAWLPTAQEPMTPVFTQWVHVGPGAVLVDTPVVFSFTRLKATVTHLEGKFEVPASGTWTAGALVAYADNKNYLGVVQGSDGMVKTFTSTAGSAIWDDLGAAPLPSAKVEAFAVDFLGGGKVSVTFNGQTFVVTSALPARGGLAASDTTGRFVGVGWK